MCGLDGARIFGTSAQGDDRLVLGPLTHGFKELIMLGDGCPNDRTGFGNRLARAQVKNQ